MMPLTKPISKLLEQLGEVLELLTNDQFILPVSVLSGATIGEHTRHILEFYIELNKGYDSGKVDYDQRKRNHAIESSKFVAIGELKEIITGLDRPDRALTLLVNYDDAETNSVSVTTNYYRELIYNLEHTVHHLALIRIGVNTVAGIAIPAGFGIAASTLKFRQACAQ
ncbi:hypothetical protein ACFQ3S_12790 [Mucilaginibacter terrae]|uniref:hypothetical protein n=1 Tax=Mucilaginibacter terrae TaxID=1955052 RepID=UPI00362586BD